MKVKIDEENFDEAFDQAYRAWTPTNVPSGITALFRDPTLASLRSDSPPFYHLLKALEDFSSEPPHVLPLTSTLPDMKADTKKYIELQKLYKERSLEEKDKFKQLLAKRGARVDEETIDSFVKNAHAIRLLRGRRWGAFDASSAELGGFSTSSYSWILSVV